MPGAPNTRFDLRRGFECVNQADQRASCSAAGSHSSSILQPAVRDYQPCASNHLDVIRPDTDNKDARGLVGVDHVAFAYDSLADLLETYAELKAKQIVPYWAVHHGMSASLYDADPDGNQMEFTVDAFPDIKACHDFFQSGVMDQTGVGTRFDPDDWLARIRGGADAPARLTPAIATSSASAGATS